VGQAKTRKIGFLLEHPYCCFCGGKRAATTIDHVPNRACFNGRNGPEGYEFPACSNCQIAQRQHEQFFAFMCHLSDRDNDNYDREMSRRLMTGIHNNLPHLYPRIVNGANERRRGLRRLGLRKPPGKTLEQMPLVEFPREIDPVLRLVATKLGLALFYKHKGYAASLTHGVASYWAQAVDNVSMARFEEIIKELQFVHTGHRTNLNFGNRFSYLWNVEETGEPDIFIVVAKFGEGLTICSMITEQSFWIDDDKPEHWLMVKDFASGNYRKDWLKSR
jgi:hypothetical protein